MTEEWRNIPRYSGLYEVSSHGRVRSLGRTTHTANGQVRKYQPRMLRPCTGTYGYNIVRLSKDCRGRNERVNRLVCEAFHGPAPSDKHQAAHNNGVTSDDRAENVRWATHTENMHDKKRHGTENDGANNGMSKLTETCVRTIRDMHRSGEYNQNEIAEKFGVRQSCVSKIVLGQRWSHLTGVTNENQ